MSIWRTEIGRAWRRFSAAGRVVPLARRPEHELNWVGDSPAKVQQVLLDTTVYVDMMRAALPDQVDELLDATRIWHSAVAVAELAHASTRVAPGHANHREVVQSVLTAIHDMPRHRLLVPDGDLWRDAGLLDGLLARLEGRPARNRRRTLNDALTLLLARRHGFTLLTRNRQDFDLLQQLVPDANFLLYRLAAITSEVG